MVNLYERVLPTRRGRIRNLMITSRTRIQLRHLGRLYIFRSLSVTPTINKGYCLPPPVDIRLKITKTAQNLIPKPYMLMFLTDMVLQEGFNGSPRGYAPSQLQKRPYSSDTVRPQPLHHIYYCFVWMWSFAGGFQRVHRGYAPSPTS